MKVTKILLALLLIAALSVAGCVSGISGEKTLEDGTIVKADGTMIKPDGTTVKPDGTMILPDGTMILPEDAIMEKNESAMTENNGTSMFSDEGLTKFANNFYRYDPDAYQKALADGKVIFLSFRANWCPICNVERPDILEGMNSINYDNVVGFEVHYNDAETKSFDNDLIKQHQVAYQHTKVIIDKNGKVILKSLEVFSSDRLVSEIEKARNA